MKRLRFLAFPVLALAAACGDSSDDTSGQSDSLGDGSTGTADDDATDPSDASTSDPDTATATTTADGTGSSAGTTASSSATDDDTGPGPAAPCVEDDDCIVIDDCCRCAVVPAADAPTCDEPPCIQSRCNDLGFTPQAQCELGSCEPVPVPCDPGGVTCDSVPPSCQAGFFPGVDPEANCWTGGCVPADACDVVPDCADCPEGEACVQYDTMFGPDLHCAPIPAACDGTPSCACMSEACVEPFGSCGDGPDGMRCACEGC
jgi:hypothetical protein